MRRLKIVLAIALSVFVAVGVVYLFQKQTGTSDDFASKMSAVECHARNLSYETLQKSHLEPDGRREQEAIIRVVLKRKQLGRKGGYADTDCGVIYQRNQFSWTRDTSLLTKIPDDPVRWAYMQTVAREMLAGRSMYEWPKSHECITHYKRADNHGVGRGPSRWFQKNLRPIAVIGKHEFFCPRTRVRTSYLSDPGSNPGLFFLFTL